MPSRWPFLCCSCDTEDKYRESYARTNAKARGKHGNGTKATWTRRSLLENEHSEFHEIGHNIYHLRNGEIQHKNEMDSSKEQDENRRRSAQEVFRHHDASQDHVASTTFPWMNEDFNVSNGRSVTRLGISSVKINAKRNEQANKNNFHRLVESASVEKSDSRKIPLMPSSEDFNESQHSNGGIYMHRKPMIRTTATQNSVRTSPNGYLGIVRTGNQINANASVNNEKQTISPQDQSRRDQPLVLHAPHSGVAVRVTQTGSHKAKQIPKLGDYLVLKPESSSGSTFGKQDYGVRQGAIRAPIPLHMRDHTADNQSDISFSSEITFRKSNISFEVNDFSLKRSKRPGIFSNNNKYEKFSAVKTGSRIPPKHTKEQTGTAESMYGYVPKAVQNVHASNALSGGKIDDFFLQRMNERENETFDTFDRKDKKNWSDFMDANYLGDTGIKGMTKEVSNQVNATNNSHISSSANQTQNTNNYASPPRVGLGQIRLQPPPSKQNINAKPQQRQMQHLDKNLDTSNTYRDENENNVIMINFPPNLSKSEIGCNSLAKLNENGGVNTRHTSGESIPIGDILSETEQVFY